MLAALGLSSQVAETADVVLVVLGGVCVLGYAVWLVGSGRWRDPLAGVESTGDGPSLLNIGAVLLMLVGLTLVLASALLPPQGVFPETGPGTVRWYTFNVAESLAKLICAGAMIMMLRQTRSFRDAGRAGLGVGRLVAIGIGGALVVATICTVQLKMTTIMWQWLHPGQTPPVHPVLIALRDNAWGNWGCVTLLLSATLVAPLAEELFFRGLVLQATWRYTGHAWGAVLTSGLAFGWIHGQPQDVLPLCTMGLILGYVRMRTRSLTACVLIHMLFNARTMVTAILFPELLTAS
ncbi:MAG: CPBP family intramembrane metalloprotease [Phycisphaerae bacterium]|jgi:membrane protease YdiL (CAAX protease family)